MLTASLVNKYLPDATDKLPRNGRQPLKLTRIRTSLPPDQRRGADVKSRLSSINATRHSSQLSAAQAATPAVSAPQEARYTGRMARWPRHVWTSIFTYGTVFVLFPLLCFLAYWWVRG